MKLHVWSSAMDILGSLNACLGASNIPFKPKNQLLDSAQSISSNIAEGYCRRHLNEYIQYLYIALGSAGETTTRIIGLEKLALLTTKDSKDLLQKMHEIELMLLGLVRALEEKRDRGDWVDRIAEEELQFLHENIAAGEEM